MKSIDISVLINMFMKSYNKCGYESCKNCKQEKNSIIIKTKSEDEFKIETEMCDDAIELIKKESLIDIKKK